MKNLVILLVVFSVFVTSDIYAQSDTSKVETVIYQSPDFPEFKAISVVNYLDYSSVYVHWAESDFNIDKVEVYESNQLIEWTTPIDRKAYLISLNTDEDYTVVLLEDNVVINTKRFSTYSSDNKIEVSEDLYEVLTKAGRKEKYEDALCDALLTADVDFEEKLSFYQKFYMDGLKFQEGDGVDFESYIPETVDTSLLSITECGFDFVHQDCKCKIVTYGANLNSIGEAVGDWHIPDETIKRYQNGSVVTFTDQLRIGPAKHVALRQDHTWDHSAPFALTNGDNVRNAKIQFFNLCDFGNGQDSGVPEECQCSKEIDVSAEYNTKMYVKSDAGGVLAWDSWARANVLEGAFLVEINESNAEAVLIDGSSAQVMEWCETDLDDEWVNSFVDIIAAGVEAYLTGLITDTDEDENEDDDEDDNNNIPIFENIAENLDEIVEDVKYIINNSPVTQSGTCGDQNDVQQLVGVHNHTTSLSPNDEVQFILFSTDLSYVGGGGTWTVRSGISSDFHLAGVVTSGLDVTESSDPCCGDKVASYTCASIDASSTSNVQIDAPNSLVDVLNRVGWFYTPYGTWNEGFESANNNTGVLVPIADHNNLRGVDCRYTAPGSANALFVPKSNTFDSYQLSHSSLKLKLGKDKLEQGVEINVYIYDVLGRVSYDGTATINSSGSIIINHNLNQGLYFIVAEKGTEFFKSKIFIK